jgi:hypothetical protein
LSPFSIVIVVIEVLKGNCMSKTRMSKTVAGFDVDPGIGGSVARRFGREMS